MTPNIDWYWVGAGPNLEPLKRSELPSLPQAVSSEVAIAQVPEAPSMEDEAGRCPCTVGFRV